MMRALPLGNSSGLSPNFSQKSKSLHANNYPDTVTRRHVRLLQGPEGAAHLDQGGDPAGVQEARATLAPGQEPGERRRGEQAVQGDLRGVRGALGRHQEELLRQARRVEGEEEGCGRVERERLRLRPVREVQLQGPRGGLQGVLRRLHLRPVLPRTLLQLRLQLRHQLRLQPRHQLRREPRLHLHDDGPQRRLRVQRAGEFLRRLAGRLLRQAVVHVDEVRERQEGDDEDGRGERARGRHEVRERRAHLEGRQRRAPEHRAPQVGAPFRRSEGRDPLIGTRRSVRTHFKCSRIIINYGFVY